MGTVFWDMFALIDTVGVSAFYTHPWSLILQQLFADLASLHKFKFFGSIEQQAIQTPD